jgi:zinc protease
MPPGRIDEASRAVLDEILRLGREEVGAQELAKARTMLESDRIYDKETVQGYARKLGFFSAIAGDISFEERYFERLQKITAADLKRVAGTYLRVGNLTAFAQVPEARVDRQKEKADKTGAKLRAVPRPPRPAPPPATPGPPPRPPPATRWSATSSRRG